MRPPSQASAYTFNIFPEIELDLTLAWRADIKQLSQYHREAESIHVSMNLIKDGGGESNSQPHLPCLHATGNRAHALPPIPALPLYSQPTDLSHIPSFCDLSQLSPQIRGKPCYAYPCSTLPLPLPERDGVS